MPRVATKKAKTKSARPRDGADLPLDAADAAPLAPPPAVDPAPAAPPPQPPPPAAEEAELQPPTQPIEADVPAAPERPERFESRRGERDKIAHSLNIAKLQAMQM